MSPESTNCLTLPCTALLPGRCANLQRHDTCRTKLGCMLIYNKTMESGCNRRVPDRHTPAQWKIHTLLCMNNSWLFVDRICNAWWLRETLSRVRCLQGMQGKITQGGGCAAYLWVKREGGYVLFSSLSHTFQLTSPQ